MASPANELELVRALFTSLEAGETEDVLRMIHPDIRWFPIESSGVRGRSAARKRFEELRRERGRPFVQVRDIFRLREWVVALGTVDGDWRSLGMPLRVGWNLKIADGLVCEARGFESWSRTLEMTGVWAGRGPEIDGDASSGDEGAPERRDPSQGRSHPHRAPSLPSVSKGSTAA